ncbi:MAG: GNAT family protein [Bdellovibrionales bacterium]|nr:GNAT family protein [Bdellovibrionales bacterium]
MDMVNEREIASAAGRRPVGNRKVAPQHLDAIEGVVLSGLRTFVKPIKGHDAADIFIAATESAKSESIWNYLSYGPFTSEAEVQTWLLNCEASKDPIFMSFCDRKTGRTGGMGSFMRIQSNTGVAEIGNIWFSLAWQNTIQATEVLSLMMYHILETKAYRRLEWKCDALNKASRAAALRLGFRYEGVFLNHMIVKGRNRDTAWFSLTKEEWPAIHTTHIRWLAPENFDTEGRQKCSLSDLTSALW